MQTHTHAQTRIHTDIYTHAQTRIHTDIYTHAQTHIHTETFDYSHGARQAPRTITNHRPLENSSWNNGPRNSPRTNQMRGSSERFQTPPPERHSPTPVKPAGNRIMIDSIINPPGRSSRPPKIVIILRGLPGSGKSHLGRLIKDKELEQGGEQPRILALDDYFDVDGKVCDKIIYSYTLLSYLSMNMMRRWRISTGATSSRASRRILMAVISNS